MFDLLLSPSNLKSAWDEVASKKSAPGVDEVTIKGWRRNWEERLVHLAQSVRANTYKPQRVRYYYIPKKDGGFRRLSILTVNDRVLQRAFLRVVDERFERHFLGCSFGFRKKIGLRQAVVAILGHRRAGRRWVLDADIDACFDNLDHELLLGYFQEVIPDPRLLRLLKQWLAMDKGFVETRRGVLQGAVISPLLCNIYLHHLDQALVNRGFQSVRYADDFCVFCETEARAVAAMHATETILTGIRLRLEPAKTAIAHFDHGFDFLGVHFFHDNLYYEAEDQIVEIRGDWDAKMLYRLPPKGYE